MFRCIAYITSQVYTQTATRAPRTAPGKVFRNQLGVGIIPHQKQIIIYTTNKHYFYMETV